MASTEPKDLRQQRRILLKAPAKRSADDLRRLAASLSNVKFFQSLDPGVRLQCCRALKYDARGPGDIVFEEGDEASLFYVVLAGSVGVFIKDVTADEAAHEGDKKEDEQRQIRERQRKADEEQRAQEKQWDQYSKGNRHNVLQNSKATTTSSLTGMAKKVREHMISEDDEMEDDDGGTSMNLASRRSTMESQPLEALPRTIGNTASTPPPGSEPRKSSKPNSGEVVDAQAAGGIQPASSIPLQPGGSGTQLDAPASSPSSTFAQVAQGVSEKLNQNNENGGGNARQLRKQDSSLLDDATEKDSFDPKNLPAIRKPSILAKSKMAGVVQAFAPDGRRVSFLRHAMKLKQVATLPAGSAFGEVALQTDQPRSATIKTMEVTHFATLDRADYSRVLKRFLEKQQQERTEFLCRVSLFADWTVEERSKVSFLLQHKTFKKNEVVYQCDSPVLEIFIVKEGEFAVQRKLDSMNDDSQREISTDPLPPSTGAVEATKENKAVEKDKKVNYKSPWEPSPWFTVGLVASSQMFGFTAYMKGDKNHRDQVVCNSIDGDVYCILCHKLISRLTPELRQKMLIYARKIDKFYDNRTSVAQQLAYHTKAPISAQPPWARGARLQSSEDSGEKTRPNSKSAEKAAQAAGGATFNVYTPEGRLRTILAAFPKPPEEKRGKLFKGLEPKKKRGSAVVAPSLRPNGESSSGSHESRATWKLKPCWHMEATAALPPQELAAWKPQLKDLSKGSLDALPVEVIVPKNKNQLRASEFVVEDKPRRILVPDDHLTNLLPESPEKQLSALKAPCSKITKMFAGGRELMWRGKDIQEVPPDSEDEAAVHRRMVENIQEQLVDLGALHAENTAEVRGARKQIPKRIAPKDPFAQRGGLRGDREASKSQVGNESCFPGSVKDPRASKHSTACFSALPDPKEKTWKLPDLRFKLHKLPEKSVLGPLTLPLRESPSPPLVLKQVQESGVSLPSLPVNQRFPDLESEDKGVEQKVDQDKGVEQKVDKDLPTSDMPSKAELPGQVEVVESLGPEERRLIEEFVQTYETEYDKHDDAKVVEKNEMDLEPYEAALTAFADSIAIPRHWHCTATLVEGYVSAGISCQHKPDLLKVALETSHRAIGRVDQRIPNLSSEVEFKPKMILEKKNLFSSQTLTPRALEVAVDPNSVYSSTVNQKIGQTKGCVSPASTAASWRSAVGNHDSASAPMSTCTSWRSLHNVASSKSLITFTSH